MYRTYIKQSHDALCICIFLPMYISIHEQSCRIFRVKSSYTITAKLIHFSQSGVVIVLKLVKIRVIHTICTENNDLCCVACIYSNRRLGINFRDSQGSQGFKILTIYCLSIRCCVFCFFKCGVHAFLPNSFLVKVSKGTFIPVGNSA